MYQEDKLPVNLPVGDASVEDCANHFALWTDSTRQAPVLVDLLASMTAMDTPVAESSASATAAMYEAAPQIRSLLHEPETAEWRSAGVPEALQWLMRGTGHQDVGESLQSSGAIQRAMETLLHHPPAAAAPLADDVAAALPRLEGSPAECVAVCVLLQFHGNSVVRRLARKLLLRHIGVVGAANQREASSAQWMTMWQLGLELLCCFKHITLTAPVLTERREDGKQRASDTRSKLLVEGIYALLTALTAFDRSVTRLREQVPADVRASCGSDPVAVLLLGGSMLFNWLFRIEHNVAKVYKVSVSATPAAASLSAAVGWAVADEMDPSVVQISTHFARLLNQRLKEGHVGNPPAAAALLVDTKKSLMKIAVHCLLDNAKGVPASKPEEERRWQRLCSWWLLTSCIEPLPNPVQEGVTATPPEQSAGWILRVVLLNAASQLRFSEAIEESKQRSVRGANPTSALSEATYGVHALFATAEMVVPTLVYSPFFHQMLEMSERETSERKFSTLAIGGALLRHSDSAVWLLGFLLKLDMIGLSPRSPKEHVLKPFSRVWSNYAIILRQMVLMKTPPTLFLALVGKLGELFAAQHHSVWVLLFEVLAAGPPPLGDMVHHLALDVMTKLGGMRSDILQFLSAPSSAADRTEAESAAAQMRTYMTAGVPRLVHLLQLAASPDLRRLGDTFAQLFLASLHATTVETFASDAAEWVLKRIIFAQSELTDPRTFLAVGDATVDNLARSQGRLWLRLCARCNLIAVDDVMASVLWWTGGLLAEVVSLSSAERATLLERVVLHLPALVATRAPAAAPEKETIFWKELIHQHKRHVAEQVNVLASHKLYGIASRLLQSLLHKCNLYPPVPFTTALLHVAGALPVAQVTADAELQHAVPVLLVQVLGQLPAEQQDTIKRYAPQWLNDALAKAVKTVDDSVAEQNRRFQQYEWEEKNLLETAELAAKKRKMEEAVQSVNEAGRRRELEVQQRSAPVYKSTIPIPVKREEALRTIASDSEDEEGLVVTTAADKEPPLPPAKKVRFAVTGPTKLQIKKQELQAAEIQRQSRRADLVDWLQAMQHVAMRTNVTMQEASFGDIIGTSRHCIAPSVPVIPEVFVPEAALSDTTAHQATLRMHSASKNYVDAFAPHVALELRYSTLRDAEEWIGRSANAAAAAAASPARRPMSVPKSKEELEDAKMEYSKTFPVSPSAANESVPVLLQEKPLTNQSQPDQWEVTFTACAKGMQQQLLSDLSRTFNINDIVLILLPLATVLDTCLADALTASGGAKEKLLSSIPSKWRQLGCMVHTAVVVSSTRDSAKLSFTTQRNFSRTTFESQILFQHALMAFHKSHRRLFLKVISSVNGARYSMQALHNIAATHFAKTLYDPRKTARASKAYYDAMTEELRRTGDFDRLRQQLLLHDNMNEWQAMAVLAVMFAVNPSWDRTVPLLGEETAEERARRRIPLSYGNAASSHVHVQHTSWRDTPSPEMLLVEGPPGTGKTQTIAGLLLNLVLQKSDLRVLICAPSNCAVDGALLRLRQLQDRLKVLLRTTYADNMHVRRVSEASVLRIGVRDNTDFAVLDLFPPVFIDDLVDERLEQAKTTTTRQGPESKSRPQLKAEVAHKASFLFSTLGSLNQVSKLYNDAAKFDLVLVDEISQGTEPDVLQALMMARSKVVFFGDSKQLQPTVLCASAAAHGFSRSLLARLVYNGHPSFILRTQYRMHPDIAAFPNGYVYESKLQDAPLNLQRGLVADPATTPFLKRTVAQKLGPFPRFAFVNVQSGKQNRKRSSYENVPEAQAVVQHMRQIRAHLQLSIHAFAQHAGIITFYRAQRDLILRTLTREERDSGLQVATVDSFQGLEKDIILISCVRGLDHKKAKLLRSPTDRTDTVEGEAFTDEESSAIGTESDTASLALLSGIDKSDARARLARQLLGFISDWHRTNVSLTRAKELCVVYAHAPLLQMIRQCCDVCGICPHGGVLDAPTTVDSTKEEVLAELRRLENDPLLLYELMQHAKEHTPGCSRDTPAEWKKEQPRHMVPQIVDVDNNINEEEDAEFPATHARAAYIDFNTNETLIQKLSVL